MRTFEPLPRPTITLPDREYGPIVTPVEWSAGDRFIAQMFWTSTDKDADAWTCDESEVRRVINFGMKAQPVPHGTPKGHSHLTVNIEDVDLATAEQILRHRVSIQTPDGDGTGWMMAEWAPNISKKSHRYVTAKPRAYIPHPEAIRGQKGRPGAYERIAVRPEYVMAGLVVLSNAYAVAFEAYKTLVEDFTWAPELARMVLPVGTFTRMYATNSYRNWFNFLLQRNDVHAQLEARMIAEQIASKSRSNQRRTPMCRGRPASGFP